MAKASIIKDYAKADTVGKVDIIIKARDGEIMDLVRLLKCYGLSQSAVV